MSAAPKAAPAAAAAQPAQAAQGENKLQTVLRTVAMFAVVQIGKPPPSSVADRSDEVRHGIREQAIGSF